MLRNKDSTFKTAQLKSPLKQKSSVADAQAIEYLKCKNNPLYFGQNYVYVEETGGALKLTPELMHNKVRRVVRSLYLYKNCVFMASRQLGKALDIKTPIPLPCNEWTTMEKLKIGDIILDEKHNPTKVIAVTDIMYNHECYKMNFKNSSSIIADKDHLWVIDFPPLNYKKKICTTKEIFNILNKNLFFKPFISCNEFNFFITSIERVDSVPVKCIQVDSSNKMYLCGNSKIPTHNSTIAAIMIDWAMTFYSRIPCVILNMKKNAALKNLERIKFIHENLPPWMRVPSDSKSDIKTYFSLSNKSRVDVYYPSTVHDPSTLARSLTIPILYIDEAAFITHMAKIFGSAQQTLSKAREQALKWNYPTFILVTSTPNGVYGDGEWFYKRYMNAVESDELFITNDKNFEDWRTDIDIDARVKDMTRNGFIKVKYHWSEDPTKSQEWYEQQCRELDDERMINQELDLIFVGSSKCIFSDKILSLFKKKDYEIINFPKSQVDMRLFETKIDPLDYYLVGVDSASSTRGAFDSIEIFGFKNFNQIAEINIKLGSLTKYGELVDQVFQWLYKIVGNRIILCIENNSIGKAIIEHLMYHPEKEDFNYLPFIFKPEESKEYGINTNAKTKELMIACLYQEIKDNPGIIKSDTLIAQLSTIERSNSGTVSSKSYSDLFMATCFCAYVRKLKSLDIMPLLEYSTEDLNKQFLEDISITAKYSDPKTKVKEDQMKEEMFINTDKNKVNLDDSISILIPVVDDDMYSDNNNDSDSDFFGFF